MTRFLPLLALMASPALLMFVSANVVNVGNFAFNLIFSRLMTPQAFADLTFVLTVKLVVLSILTALQMALSQQVAAGRLGDAQRLLKRPGVLGLSLLAISIGVLGFSGQPIGRGLAMLALACPFILPLVLLRGLALGRIDMMRTIASAQLEMVFRLGLSLLAWGLGLGLTGLGAALALSLVVAWLPLRGQLNQGTRGGDTPTITWTPLIVAALPFGMLQLAQVLMLDGDILIGRWVLDGQQAGLLAALGLIQRVQFFACFGLATILVPTLIQRRNSGQSLLPPLLIIGGLYALTALPLLLASIYAPASLIKIIVGSAYVSASPVAWMAVASACLLTLTYLILTALLALGNQRLLWLALGFAGAQILGLGVLGAFFDVDLAGLLSWKLLCQSGLILLIAGFGLRPLLKSA